MNDLETEFIAEAVKRDLAKVSHENLQKYAIRVWNLYQKERSHNQYLVTKFERSSKFWFRFCLLWMLAAAIAVFAAATGV